MNHNDHSAEDLQENAQNLLSGLRQIVEEAEERVEKITWKPLSPPFTLPNILPQLRMKTLLAMIYSIFGHGYKGIKKAQAVEIIEEFLLSKLKLILGGMKAEDLPLLAAAAEANGIIEVEDKCKQDIEEIYSTRGLLFTGTHDGKRLLIMPEEVVGVLKHIDMKAVEADINEINKDAYLIIGIMYYYGCIGIWKLKDILESHFDISYSNKEFADYLERICKKHRPIRICSGYLCHERVRRPEDVIVRQNSRSDLDFKILDRHTCRKAARPGFIMENEGVSMLETYLNTFFMGEDGDDDEQFDRNTEMLEETVTLAQLGVKSGALLENLHKYYEDMGPKFADMLNRTFITLYNKTNAWVLKGHCPEEVNEAEVYVESDPFDDPALCTTVYYDTPAESKPVNDVLPGASDSISPHPPPRKTGRNEPCGSGKKYKHCCLKQ